MASSPAIADAALSNIRALIVEDDPEVAQAISLYLELVGCLADVAADGARAIDQAARARYDVIVLDLSLPMMDGLAVCKMLRQQRVFTPILMLTARASEADRVLGLDAGADDYLTKPYSPLELQARLNALLRRANKYSAPQIGTRLDFGELTIDILCRTVSVRGQHADLTAREFDLLLALAQSPGRVYTREQLLDCVWGYSHAAYGHTVNSHINRLRAKIELDAAAPEYVHTVWGVGYKFGGPQAER